MQTIRAVLIAAVVLVLPAPPRPPRRGNLQLSRVRPPWSTATRCSLMGIVFASAPCTRRGGRAGGTAAKEMAALAILGEHVVCAVLDTDRSRRLVADCTMSSDGADFAEVTIRAGHAAHCPAHGRPDRGRFLKTASSCPPITSVAREPAGLRGLRPCDGAPGAGSQQPRPLRAQRRHGARFNGGADDCRRSRRSASSSSWRLNFSRSTACSTGSRSVSAGSFRSKTRSDSCIR